MAVPITVPRLGWSMEEGTFVEWLKRPGERVQPGEALFALESDKATENIEALDAGVLHIGPDGPRPGDKVKVGQVIGYVAAEGETVSVAAPGAAAPVPRVPTVATQPVAAARADAKPQVPAITPRARRVARELGVDTSAVLGGGRNGRVRERDVRAAAVHALPGRVIPFTPIRRAIAERMVAAVTQAAPVTLTTEADATELIRRRQQLKAGAGPGDLVPTYTDLIVVLTAAVLRQHPGVQAQWRGDGLFVPDRVHIALAVQTDAGLLAPVLRDVDQLSVQQVAERSRALIERARTGRLAGEEMRGGTFTVSNLGMFGVDVFTPLLHLQQAAVLGVGRIRRAPAVVNEQIVPRDLVTLSLTFDHRVLDGAPAARFLDDVRRGIEAAACGPAPAR